MPPQDGCWAVRSRRTSTTGVGKAQSEVPAELPGAGFGVSGLMEAKTSRFSLLGTANSAEGRGRAENSVWACWWTLVSEQREKGQEERALAGYRREESPCLIGG